MPLRPYIWPGIQEDMSVAAFWHVPVSCRRSGAVVPSSFFAAPRGWFTFEPGSEDGMEQRDLCFYSPPLNAPVRQSTMSRVYPLPLAMPNIQRYIHHCPPGQLRSHDHNIVHRMDIAHRPDDRFHFIKADQSRLGSWSHPTSVLLVGWCSRPPLRRFRPFSSQSLSRLARWLAPVPLRVVGDPTPASSSGR